MKLWLFLCLGIVLASTALLHAASDEVVSVGADHRVVRTSSGVTYHEIQTGMHYLKGGQWAESREEIESFPRGAIFRQGRHNVIFARNINTHNAIDLEMVDGTRLKSTILGVALFDYAAGKSILIGELTNSVGELAAPNQILYRNAFDGISGDVRYTITKAGLEQDVIITGTDENLNPASYGLDPTTTRMEVLTEFFDPPTPHLSHQPSSGTTTNGLGFDHGINFGAMQMGEGSAFLEPPRSASVHVQKSWGKAEGRTFLVESVLFTAISEHLKTLPSVASRRIRSPLRIVAIKGDSSLASLGASRSLPPSNSKSQPEEPIRFAGNKSEPKGLVLDYIIQSGTADLTFREGTTYYISGSATMTGTTTLEGGAIIKFANTNNAKIIVSGYLDVQSSPYRPAIFTARDDDSVGATITGSSGAPSGYYATIGLDVNCQASGNSATLHDVRVSYAQTGISIHDQGTGLILRNLQIVNCNTAINANNVKWWGQNILACNGSNFCSGTSPVTGVLENFTADGFTNFVAGSGNLSFTNCAIANMANLYGSGSSMVITGSYNGFYGSSTFGLSTVSSGSNPFQTVLGGSYYLAPNSVFLDAGTTNINSATAMWLKYKTTYPPVYLGSVSNDTTIMTQAQRDTDTPDIGYHYDPIDYLVKDVTITNATLVVTNGASLGFYGTNGITLKASGKLVGEGTPMNMNEMSRYYAVQENSTTGNGNATDWTILQDESANGTNTEIRLRFTEISMTAVSEDSANATGSFFSGNGNLNILAFQDSALYGAKIIFTNGTTFAATNILFEYPLIKLGSTNHSVIAHARNNLFIKSGLLNLAPQAGNAWSFYDNQFDLTNIVQNANSITNDYNAYINSAPRITSNGSHDQILGSFKYLIGTLGRYYQPSDSALIDAGSRASTNAGLYHFTTQLSQVKETNSTVDIGLHYIALQAISTNVWVEDAIPSGASAVGDSDGWNWVSSSPTQYSGTQAHKSANVGYAHQHYFTGATTPLVVNRGEAFFTYIYLDGGSTPSQAELQFLDEIYWLHRPYWGTGSPVYGADGTDTARYMGPLPSSGAWKRLDLAPEALGMEGYSLNGMAFTLANNLATWDYSGKVTLAPWDADGDGLPDYMEDRNGNGLADNSESSWLLSDTDGDGISDYLEWVQGRNPNVSGATADSGNLINLRTYTPLK